MTKIIAFILLFTSVNAYSFDDEKIISTGIKINSQGKKIFFSFSQENKKIDNNPKINFELPILQRNNQLNYSGYRNVEGFENKSPKIQRNLTIGFVTAAIAILAAGTFTVAKIVDVIDD